MYAVNIRSHLKEYRVQAGLTRRQLGDMVGVSFETIKAYEDKGAVPSLRVAFKLAHILQCDVEDLFEPNITKLQ